MPIIEVKLYDKRVTEESVPKIIEALTDGARGVVGRRARAHPGDRAGRLAEALGHCRQAAGLARASPQPSSSRGASGCSSTCGASG